MQSLVFLLKEKKNKTKESLPESLDCFSDTKFVHGWLMFDPLFTFFKEGELPDDVIVLRDSCIWFLNMAYMYTECMHEKTLDQLDFGMYRYLKPHQRSKWIKDFKLLEALDKELQEQERQFKNQDPSIPYWFTWVTRWFMHGLHGPFGKVRTWSEELETTFFEYPPKFQYAQCPPNLVPNSSSLVFQQKDTFNCGVCCLLFVYDLLVSQAFTSWQQKITEADTLPNEIIFGASVFKPDWDIKKKPKHL